MHQKEHICMPYDPYCIYVVWTPYFENPMLSHTLSCNLINYIVCGACIRYN